MKGKDGWYERFWEDMAEDRKHRLEFILLKNTCLVFAVLEMEPRASIWLGGMLYL